ncbi:MAG: LPXTG cell wall anchor domain-containing protein, partial [Clostridiales bacterium]|nr:LPXTG cell wall anchor domain-containing protein [Clostridiales bacterium]
IVISYTATVNEKAVIGSAGNPNESKIEYGESGKTTTTPPSKTTTYTWSFDVLKYGNNDESKVLKDAQFVLLNNGKTKVATIVNGKLTGWVDVPTAGEDRTITWPANTVLTTGADGKIAIAGLDSDTYYLREVEAPAGYNKLAEDKEVKIAPTAGENNTLSLAPLTVKVNNQSGAELPSTGGIGTTIFYIVGAVLVLGASVLLVTKRRMNNDQ